jgi:hypothetical protein
MAGQRLIPAAARMSSELIRISGIITVAKSYSDLTGTYTPASAMADRVAIR